MRKSSDTWKPGTFHRTGLYSSQGPRLRDSGTSYACGQASTMRDHCSRWLQVGGVRRTQPPAPHVEAPWPADYSPCQGPISPTSHHRSESQLRSRSGGYSNNQGADPIPDPGKRDKRRRNRGGRGKYRERKRGNEQGRGWEQHEGSCRPKGSPEGTERAALNSDLPGLSHTGTPRWPPALAISVATAASQQHSITADLRKSPAVGL